VSEDSTYQEAARMAAARMVGEFYLELVSMGIPEESALELTLEFMRQLYALGKSQ
jgi:hypothetical protein